MLLDQNLKTLINMLNITFTTRTYMTLSNLLSYAGNHKFKTFSILFCTVAGCAIAMKKPPIGGIVAIAGILLFARDYINSRSTNVEKLKDQYSQVRGTDSSDSDNESKKVR